MQTLTITYSRHVAATARLDALQAAYDSLPAARAAMGRSKEAHKLIEAASDFQAQLRNTLGRKSSSVAEFARAATAKPRTNQTLLAQLAVASAEPRVNMKMDAMLAAHVEFQQSVRPSFPRRLLGAILGR